MTIETFVVALATTPGDWFLDDPTRLSFQQAIRRIDNNNGHPRVCCPITALGQEFQHSEFLRDAGRLGLSLQDAVTICATADGITNHEDFDPVLRLKLLKATVLRDRTVGDMLIEVA